MEKKAGIVKLRLVYQRVFNFNSSIENKSFQVTNYKFKRFWKETIRTKVNK